MANTTDDLSDLIAECEVLLRCFGISKRSPLLPRILHRYDIFPAFNALDSSDLLELRNALQTDWNTIPIELRSVRAKTQSLMQDLRLEWHSPAIANWASARGVKLSQLSIDDFEDLHSRLSKIATQLNMPVLYRQSIQRELG